MSLPIAMGAMGAGTLLNAYGTYQQGVAQRNYYRYLENAAQIESDQVQKQADQESSFAQDAGARETGMLKRKVSEVEGTQRAIAGANVGGGSVTTQDIQKDTFDKAKMDELAIRYNADLTSWKTQEEAKAKQYSLAEQKKMNRYAGESAYRSGKRNAFTSLIGGAGQVAGTWYAGKNTASSMSASTSPGSKSLNINNRYPYWKQ